MSEKVEFDIGAEVACSDGACGSLRRVVIDPIARAVTHLVVEPSHARAMGHLVPINLVDTTTKEIRLRCTTAQFEALEDAEETQFVPGATGQWGYGPGEMLSLPYFGLGVGMGVGPQRITYDRVPVGDIEVRRGEHVHATDGPIGRVQGLVIDPADHHVTHVLLNEGHLWGEKEVAIPISAVNGVDDGIRLSLTKDEVRDLPSVEIDHDV